MSTEAAEDDYLDRPLRDLFDNVAGTASVPAAGSVVATLGALSAGLAAKVAHRSHSRLHDAEEIAERADALRRRFEPVITADAIGYAAALAVRGTDRDAALDSLSLQLMLMVEAAAEVAELASDLVIHGNPNLRHDADASVRIAVTVTEVGLQLIGANVSDSEMGVRALAAVARAREAAAQYSVPGT